MSCDPKVTLADDIERFVRGLKAVGFLVGRAHALDRDLAILVHDNVDDILAALRSADTGAAMRERCAQACDRRSATISARADRLAAHQRAAASLRGKADEARACAGVIRALPLQEESPC